MRRNLIPVILMIMLSTIVIGCSSGSDNTEKPVPAEQPTEQQADETVNQTAGEAETSSTTETINGMEVHFDKNDLVLIAEYQGQHLDTLAKKEYEIGSQNSTGGKNYSVAVFGSITDVRFIYGEIFTENDGVSIGDNITDTLLTFKDVPGYDDDYAGIAFFDSNGKGYEMEFTNLYSNAEGEQEVVVIQDSGINNAIVDPGHTLRATYPKGYYPDSGYKFFVEVDQTEEVTEGVLVNYLYYKKDDQDKMLIAKSIHRGEDRTNSVGNILHPTLSNDGTKVYYETDNTFSQAGEIGAVNRQTRVFDLQTEEDRFLGAGDIEMLLQEYDEPYAGYLMLHKYIKAANGEITDTYIVYTPEGEEVAILDEFDPYEGMASLITAALQSQDSSNQEDTSKQESTSDSQGSSGSQNSSQAEVDNAASDEYTNEHIKGFSSEAINGINVTYSDSINVVAPNYQGKYLDALKEKDIRYVFIGGLPADSRETHNMSLTPEKVYRNAVHFAVFGRLDSITVKYIDAANNKTETETFKPEQDKDYFKNRLVKVATNFTNDMTSIEVSFTRTLSDGKTYSGSFIMDDMRENYDPIIF